MGGWLYLATVIDIASRRIVGYAIADHLRTELVADALADAIAGRNPGPGVIFDSDRGCQGGFNWSSQHLDSEELRCGNPDGGGRDPRLPQPRRVRARQQDQEGSLTKSSAVKAGQPQPRSAVSGVARREGSGERAPPQPLPQRPAWRARLETAAGDGAGHIDPEPDRHTGTPWRTHLHAAGLYRHAPGHHPRAITPRAGAVAVDAYLVLRLYLRRARRRCRCARHVRNQRRQLAVGACRQGSTHSLVELLQGQPAITGGNSQQLDHAVAVVMRGTQVTTWHHRIAARPRGFLIGHGQTVRRRRACPQQAT